MHGRSRRTRAWQGHARARGHTTRMRVATNRAGILWAIMRPGQLKKVFFCEVFPLSKHFLEQGFSYLVLFFQWVRPTFA